MEFDMGQLGRMRAAYKQSQEVHYCATCDSYGQGQKMYYHKKNCDGSGFKNYWSRVKSDLLKAYAVGMMSLEDVYNKLHELKYEAKNKRDATL